MVEYFINNPTEKIYFVRNWINTDDSVRYYSLLKEYIQLLDDNHSATYTIKLRNKNYVLPRKIFIMGDDNITHSFGGVNFPIYPWHELITFIRDRIAKESGIKFNSCTINWYPDGNSFIADHHDSDVKSPHNAIITLSLGTSRKFNIKGNPSFSTTVNSGDIFVMAGNANTLWTHGIPKQKIRSIDPGRISLTFRDL